MIKKVFGYCNSSERQAKLLIDENVQQQKYYLLNFWDKGYVYTLGCLPSNDWIGMKCRADFDYNP